MKKDKRNKRKEQKIGRRDRKRQMNLQIQQDKTEEEERQVQSSELLPLFRISLLLLHTLKKNSCN